VEKCVEKYISARVAPRGPAAIAEKAAIQAAKAAATATAASEAANATATMMATAAAEAVAAAGVAAEEAAEAAAEAVSGFGRFGRGVEMTDAWCENPTNKDGGDGIPETKNDAGLGERMGRRSSSGVAIFRKDQLSAFVKEHRPMNKGTRTLTRGASKRHTSRVVDGMSSSKGGGDRAEAAAGVLVDVELELRSRGTEFDGESKGDRVDLMNPMRTSGTSLDGSGEEVVEEMTVEVEVVGVDGGVEMGGMVVEVVEHEPWSGGSGNGDSGLSSREAGSGEKKGGTKGDGEGKNKGEVPSSTTTESRLSRLRRLTATDV
jgi:hypothetical protein